MKKKLFFIIITFLFGQKGYSQFCFDSTFNYSVGSNPSSVKSADFNLDGRADLAIANNGSSNISILIANTSGGFNSAVSISLSNTPAELIVGDFNIDGKPDIATTGGASNLWILIGLGTGSFSSPVNYSTGIYPSSLCSGDFNGDGKLDIAVTNGNSSNSISVFIGTGTGTFGSGSTYSVGSCPCGFSSIKSADFNGDGKFDLAIANQNSNNVSVLIGTGTGSFGTASNYSVGTFPWAIVTGDFNKDSKTDIATSNRNSQNISVMYGTGTGTFLTAINYLVDLLPNTLIAEDLDGDNILDIASACYGSNTVSILKGTSLGFNAKTSLSTGSNPFYLTSFDINNDGKKDLINTNYGSSTVSVKLNCTLLPCTSPNITINLTDTTIAFKQDSILLNAGTGYSKYVWSGGDTTQSIWVKNAGIYKVTVFDSAGCSNSDSTNVIFVKGIQQKDTSICAGKSINLSIPSGTIPTNGLVGYWPFTGNANDASGNGNNGVVNGATLTSDRFGNLNSAFSFDGINDHISTLRNYQSAFSTSIWVNTPNISGLNPLIDGFDSNWEVQLNDLYPDFVSFISSNNYQEFISTTSIVSNTWTHIVFTFNANILKLYINGVLKNQFTVYTLPSNSGNYLFGASLSGADQYYLGKLDDIGIWNRSLTPYEIQSLFYDGFSVNTTKTWSTSDTTNSILVAPTTSTTYRCTQRLGSFTLIDSVRVNVRNLPSKTITYNKKGLCKNDTISINVLAGYAYNWYKNNNIIAGTNNALKAFANGNYKAKLTDSTGCSTTSDSVILFNAPLPKVKISLPDTALCLNGNLFKYTDSTTIDSGSFNRTWTFGNGNTSILSTSNQSYTSAGNYNAKLKVTTNYGCADSAIKNITVKPNPVAGVMLGQAINLTPSTPYIYTVAQQINHNYNWVVTNGIVVLGQSTNAATVQWINNGNGYIKVEVTNPQGCSDSTAVATKIGNVGMNETSEINNLSLYPNPNYGSFTVGFTLKESSSTKLELINMLGQQVWISNMQLQNGEQQIPINLSLSAGVYVLKITTSTGEITKQVLVK